MEGRGSDRGGIGNQQRSSNDGSGAGCLPACQSSTCISGPNVANHLRDAGAPGAGTQLLRRLALHANGAANSGWRWLPALVESAARADESTVAGGAWQQHVALLQANCNQISSTHQINQLLNSRHRRLAAGPHPATGAATRAARAARAD